MKIKLAAAFILMCVFCVNAQTTVTQAFVDDANAAFREVVALRTANEALGKANEAQAAAIESQKQLLELLKADNADLRKLKCDTGSLFIFVVRWKRCR